MWDGQISKVLCNDSVKEGLEEEEFKVEGPALRWFAIIQVTLCIREDERSSVGLGDGTEEAWWGLECGDMWGECKTTPSLGMGNKNGESIQQNQE